MKPNHEVGRSGSARVLDILHISLIPLLLCSGFFIAELMMVMGILTSPPKWFMSILLGMAASGVLAFMAKYSALERKHRIIDARILMEQDVRPPVLYLRSFKTDADATRRLENYSIEEQLANVLSEIGPVITIGQPSEKWPLPGAARMYVSAGEWQKTVTDLMSKAQLVVLRIGATEGFWWEVQNAVQLVKPEQLLLIAFHKRDNKYFLQRAAQYFPGQLMPPKNRLGWALYFTPDWTPQFIKMSLRFSDQFRYKADQAMTTMLKTSFRPIFTQLNVNWTVPPIRWGDVLLSGVGVIVLLLGLYFIVLK